jgi:hypothetical protein
MADKYQGETAKAAKDVDPTVRSRGAVPEYPEGTHPPAPISAQTWNGERFTYSDMPDEQKPDPSTVAQVVDEDPIEQANQEALSKDAAAGQKQAAREAAARDKANR